MRVRVMISEFSWRDASGWHTVAKGHAEVPEHPAVASALESGLLVAEAEPTQASTDEHGQTRTGDGGGTAKSAKNAKERRTRNEERGAKQLNGGGE